MSSNLSCPICLEDAVDGVNFCCDKEHEPTCRECITSLIENTVSSSFFGACPTINCPSRVHQAAKKRRILNYEEWRKSVPNNLSNKYVSLANSLLAFLCGGCHALKSLDVGCDLDHNSANFAFLMKYYAKPVGKGTIDEFHRDLSMYISGEVSVETTYQTLNSLHFPHLLTASDAESWEIMCHILKFIADPERRANLHLRYLRDRPRIKTSCCNREHCFKCKTKDFHEGKSCMENTSTLDHSVVCCPTCGISLAKGDGCNTVTCVCGKQFSWSAEKENSDRCVLFLQTHPEQTSQVCAQLLCSNCLPADLLQAKAWQIRHRVEVNRNLLSLFKVKYWPCPSQCCVVLPLDKLPEGIREAAELWKADKKEEVDKCKKQSDIAKSALFTSLYPCETDRVAAAHRLTKMIHKKNLSTCWEADAAVVASASKWVEMNREKYNKGIEELEVRSARQFLMLYGNCSIHSAKPSAVSSPSSTEWDRTASNNDLTYSNDNTSVERVGSVSCYPAAFSALTSERSMFKVVVETAPKSSNWLTFGVARRGMANSSSDGIGRTSNTWGLSDDRSSSSSNAILAANGSEVGHFRKLRVGDELSAVIDTQEGWAEISVNDQELVHRFEIPQGAPTDYWFAMTFANDHKVTIISDMLAAKTSNAPSSTLNIDHTMMYHALKKQLKSLMVEEDFTASVSSDRTVSSLKVDGSEWVKHCTDRGMKPDLAYDSIQSEINAALSGKGGEGSSASSSSSSREKLTWTTLLKAVSWYFDNRDFYARTKMCELATIFYSLHGDDAPFMAAFNLTEYHTHNVPKEEATASLAFMKIFPELANEWYAYDAASSEPMIEHVVPGCMCLPRHCKVCPKRK